MKPLVERANASVGYGPNNPEPIALREETLPLEKDALHASGEYVGEKTSRSRTK